LTAALTAGLTDALAAGFAADFGFAAGLETAFTAAFWPVLADVAFLTVLDFVLVFMLVPRSPAYQFAIFYRRASVTRSGTYPIWL
jgi:hypothetical protein